MNMLDIHNETFSERYLGLPTAMGRITSGTFDHIDERVCCKIRGWSEKNLACAGKEALLKSVVQYIPTYSMSCFLLTKKVFSKLSSHMARYWWSSSLDRRSLHWSSPKAKGGMGFRDLHLFNLALLGKHGWRYITDPNSLCARVMMAKYFAETDFMHSTVPSPSSAIWRAIVAGREALGFGLINRVGDGSSLSIWSDKWIPNTTTMMPLFKPPNPEVVMVSELIDTVTWTWKKELVRETSITPDADAILNIPLRNGGGNDFLA